MAKNIKKVIEHLNYKLPAHILLIFSLPSLLSLIPQPVAGQDNARSQAQHQAAPWQDKPAYRIFTGEGEALSYERMMQKAGQAELLFFGELHDQPLAHWLKFELTRDLHARHPSLCLGMEMLEAEDQLVLNEYLQGLIQEAHFLEAANTWDNYTTDYHPLVVFAKKHQLPFTASNIPRRYANQVARQGLEFLDSLSEEAREWVAPLPINIDLSLPGYQSMIEGMGHHVPGARAENIARAQAVKDATMAHFILENFHEPGPFLHFNGAYHSRNREGIVWYIQQQSPELRIITIETVVQQSLDSLEEKHKQNADFIVCIPESIHK